MLLHLKYDLPGKLAGHQRNLPCTHTENHGIICEIACTLDSTYSILACNTLGCGGFGVSAYFTQSDACTERIVNHLSIAMHCPDSLAYQVYMNMLLTKVYLINDLPNHEYINSKNRPVIHADTGWLPF